MIDGYIIFPSITAFETRQQQIFNGGSPFSLGYTSEVQTRTKTTRYTNHIEHPTNNSVLMIIKEVSAWDGEIARRESPLTKIMSAQEKSSLKSQAEWKASDGFFPDPAPPLIVEVAP